MSNQHSTSLLTVKNLSVMWAKKERDEIKVTKLLDDISFNVEAGQCLAIVGESGSGKSTLCKALIGLCSDTFYTSGHVIYNQQNLLKLPFNYSDWASIRGKKIAFIPQNSANAFNPLLTIGNQINETLKQHYLMTSLNRKTVINDVFLAVGLLDFSQLSNKHPYQLSGGTLQRISIALALMLNPDIIIADEPTSNIDWLTKKEILAFLKQRLRNNHKALIMITHDFADVKVLADTILVLQNGKTVEKGLANQVLQNPSHSYTQSLLAACKKLDEHLCHVP